MVAASTQAAPAMAPEESQPVAAAKVTMRPGDNIVYAAAAAAAKRKWLFGKPSHTYEESPVTGTIYVSTLEQVGYKGAADASSPKAGQVYLGSIWVGRSGFDDTGDEAVTEVMLPRKTKLAIGKSNPVRCYTGVAEGKSRQIKGKKCPNRATKGAYGLEFSPPKGAWNVPTGHWVQVIFPLRSSKPLKGLADTPAACMMGAVKNLNGYVVGPLWDAPVGGESCPTADGHGPYQGVFVAKR